MERIFTSGDLARATGETVRTVRFYEEQGLLQPATVSDGGHRRYDGNSLERLQLILDLRELGLSIPDVRAMLAMREGCRTANEFRGLLRERLPAHLARARERLERLKRLESELRQALSSVSGDDGDSSAAAPCPCDVASSDGAPRIVRVLARTGECAGRRHQGHREGANEGIPGPVGAARHHA
jgi:MerR family Zn(II)-responsive transcriptional regulator of zntA